MSEKRFVESIRQSALAIDSTSFVWKVSDKFALGIPDLLIAIRSSVMAIEAKAASRSGGMLLSHPFSAVQISVMKQMNRAGLPAFGAIGIDRNSAYIVSPSNIPSSGNFKRGDVEGMVSVTKEKIWEIHKWPSLLCLTKTRRR